jgi:hypothetical protein
VCCRVLTGRGWAGDAGACAGWRFCKECGRRWPDDLLAQCRVLAADGGRVCDLGAAAGPGFLMRAIQAVGERGAHAR